MQTLITGIHRMRRAEFRSSHALFQLPGDEQRSGRCLVACSDLPIDPYSLIPTNFANLYIFQNFGNLAAPFDPRRPDQGSSVDAALAMYPLKDLVVCGHASCDVMRNMVASVDGGDTRDTGTCQGAVTCRGGPAVSSRNITAIS